MFPSHVFAPIPFYETIENPREIITCPLSACHLDSHTHSTIKITQENISRLGAERRPGSVCMETF